MSGRGPSICCRRPFCRLKAPLGLSLLRKRGLCGLILSTRCGRVHFEHSHRKWLVITVRPTTSVRKSPRKNLPPRNTPDSFCRLLHPTKSSLRCVGGIFLLRETHLENFMSRPDVIPTFRQRRCKTGAGTSFGASGDSITRAAELSTYFCVLTIRKHLL